MAEPQQSAQQSRYVEMPNGSYLEWPEGVSADEFKAKAAKVGAPTPPPPPSTLQRAFSPATAEERQGHSLPVNMAQDFGSHVLSTLASPFKALAHPSEAAKGMANSMDLSNIGPALQEAKEHPENKPPLTQAIPQALGDVAGAYMGGEALDASVPPVLAKIPTRAKAGAVFNDIGQKMQNTPIPLAQSTPQLEQLEKIGAAGPGVPTTVGKLLDRSRMISPMNYPEARLFQENLSSPSTTEKMGMGGSMKGGVKQLNKAFYGDIKGALDPHGLGEDYAGAMRDYARAAKMNKMAKTVGKAALVGGAGALGAGTAYKLGKDLTQ